MIADRAMYREPTQRNNTRITIIIRPSESRISRNRKGGSRHVALTIISWHRTSKKRAQGMSEKSNTAAPVNFAHARAACGTDGHPTKLTRLYARNKRDVQNELGTLSTFCSSHDTVLRLKLQSQCASHRTDPAQCAACSTAAAKHTLKSNIFVRTVD